MWQINGPDAKPHGLLMLAWKANHPGNDGINVRLHFTLA
jgi:hypothetical protein